MFLISISFQLAIIEYLEETKGGPSLLPKDPKQKAIVSIV